MSQKKWYAVYSRPRWEKKVAEILTKKKIETYCPVNKVYRQWSDRKKIVLEPLFTSYVFVNIDEAGQLPVRMTDGVINFVYWLNKPAVIQNEEINIIKKFLNEYENVQVQKVPLSVNDTVRITSGPFMEQHGQIIALKNKTVKVALPSLGYVMSAEVERVNVELMHSGINSEIKILGNLALK
ncbi:MAG TPA: UpxY family transcription antiterminator [Puia sp.]|jgi:transcription antitermination factor NusG